MIKHQLALVQREIWEHRSIWITPAAVAFVLTFLAIAMVIMAAAFGEAFNPEIEKIADATVPDSIRRAALAGVLVGNTFAFLIAMWFLMIFYCLDSLYAERKDKSILFWKSLPVSDLQIVTSKLVTGAAVIPAVTLVVFFFTAIASYLIGGITIALSGSSAILAAGPGAILDTTLLFLYGFVVQSLWYLPVFGWLLLVSAWSRKATLLWAILPPWGVAALEGLIFRSDRFVDLMGERLTGVFPLAFRHGGEEIVWEGPHGKVEIEGYDGVTQLIDPGALLASPGLYGGLVVAAVLFAGAVWLRRWRDDS